MNIWPAMAIVLLFGLAIGFVTGDRRQAAATELHRDARDLLVLQA